MCAGGRTGVMHPHNSWQGTAWKTMAEVAGQLLDQLRVDAALARGDEYALG